MNVTKKHFYTVDEARETLGPVLSKCMFYKLIKQGEIPTVTIGPRKFITAGWVNRLIEQSTLAEVRNDA